MPAKNSVQEEVNALKGQWRSLLVPLLVLVVISALSITLGLNMVNRLQATQVEIDQVKAENDILATKKEALSSLNKPVLENQARVAVVAVPTENSALSALSAVRTQAFENKLQITDLKVSERQGLAKGAREVGLGFEVEGSLSDILAFLGQIQNSSPITKLVKAKLIGSGGVIAADLDFGTFWAELPTTLPPANTPLESLTSKEEQTLKTLEQLKVGGFGGAVSPASPAGKSDPFVE